MPNLEDKIGNRRTKIMEGKASYYTNASSDPRWGGIMKNGEKFDENKMTMAVRPEDYKALKNKEVIVHSNDSDRDVVVRVTDTGGFKKYNRTGDLSLGAFKKLGLDPKRGVSNVEIHRIIED